jgi:predicted flap endonuclease-1-like 5' DNA nuclease
MATYPISSIDGLTALAASRLKAAGIRTTAALLDAAKNPKGRKALSATTGLSEKQLLEWANMADKMRIKGMGAAKAQLLGKSGVTTVRELKYRNPAKLTQAMRDANEKHKLVRVLPSEKSVGQLIERARKLPLKITY